MQKIPVVHQDGTPLMPCSPSKARRLLKAGAAIRQWTKTGIFYLQLTTPTSAHTQAMVLGHDPGAHYDGVAIATAQQVQMTGMLVVKNHISKKLKQRRNMRRARRFRKTRRRPARSDNRKRPAGWLPPSIQAKVEIRKALLKDLLAIYPITTVVVEDMRIDGNQLKAVKGQKYFTWTMENKRPFYDWIRARVQLVLYEPSDTAQTRHLLGLAKTKKKGEHVFTSQAVDGLALAWMDAKTKDLRVPSFTVWRRPEVPRRQLHRFEPEKGGVRKPYGGSQALGFTKNTVVRYRGTLYRTGGTTKGKLSLHTFDFANKRVTQNAKGEECQPLFVQTWFSKRVI
ncbi:RRXRR domain-containing protein [Sulfobacillus thermosulfidooxidans]|uniref:RRXRR domain-containing protein n=1 Tax=Sulfobacillus thermosulfidooxidans TaxID=28034 RepID=UPI0002F54086|nr:RRXRR domain-containing protein [Sulfobacillus thermosulfidooxidans]